MFSQFDIRSLIENMYDQGSQIGLPQTNQLLLENLAEYVKKHFRSILREHSKIKEHSQLHIITKGDLSRYLKLIPAIYGIPEEKLQDPLFQDMLRNKNFEDIDACFIPTPFEDLTYVASEGPRRNNIETFWKMIWKSKAVTIVMLTSLEERGKVKCLKYWNSQENSVTIYENGIQVKTIESKTWAELEIITMSISNISVPEKEPRTIRLFYYKKWRDGYIPGSIHSFLHLWLKVRRWNDERSLEEKVEEGSERKNKIPLLIHCSAGIGRTGTFILIDFFLNRIKNGQKFINPYEFVLHMRRYRNEMVHRDIQYLFAHQTIAQFCQMNLLGMRVKTFYDTTKLVSNRDGGSIEVRIAQIDHLAKEMITNFHKNCKILFPDDDFRSTNWSYVMDSYRFKAQVYTGGWMMEMPKEFLDSILSQRIFFLCAIKSWKFSKSGIEEMIIPWMVLNNMKMYRMGETKIVRSSEFTRIYTCNFQYHLNNDDNVRELEVDVGLWLINKQVAEHERLDLMIIKPMKSILEWIRSYGKEKFICVLCLGHHKALMNMAYGIICARQMLEEGENPHMGYLLDYYIKCCVITSRNSIQQGYDSNIDFLRCLEKIVREEDFDYQQSELKDSETKKT